jgi:anti-sigma regulatory factor (Ser/Thr protein kinase)
MRTGAGAGHTGYLHEAALYSSDRELLDIVVPFLLGGVEAGEPTMVAFGPEHTELVRRATAGEPGIEYLSGGEMYARPAGAIRGYRKLLADCVAQGAGQIRIVGELDPLLFGPTWGWWARYESAINHAYDDFPLWSMCAYSREHTPAPIMAEVQATHPWVATGMGTHLPSATYAPPASFLSRRGSAAEDPLQRGYPLVDLTDPHPAAGRDAVRGMAGSLLPDKETDDLVLATSEVVANALRHGQGPVRLRAWVGEGRVVVLVEDAGRGPSDPYAGLLPRSDAGVGGLGLWLTHQVCSHVALDYREDGFGIRLTAGDPHVGFVPELGAAPALSAPLPA